MRTFTSDRKVDEFAPDTCAPYSVGVGELFRVEMADCFGRFPGRDQPQWSGGANPITGPIAVEGVVSGDTLAVEICELETVGDGFFGSDDDRVAVPIDSQAGVVRFPGELNLPLSPHVGTIGVAPAEEAVSTHDAGDHGGNMDCKLIGPGCLLCFTASMPGAGLGLGDVHAVMGDGEVGGQGVEVAAMATLTVRKVDGLPLRRPYGLQRDRFFLIGWGDTLNAAADMAIADAREVVTRLLGMSPGLALKFLGMAADLRVCWRGGKTPCMRVEVPLRHLPEEARREILTRLGRTDR